MTKISTEEAAALLAQGVPYLDVRTVEEFQAGHVPGSLNLPLRLSAPGGMVENPDFGRVARALFSDDEKLIVGCRSGARSAAALELLGRLGIGGAIDMTAGFEGKRDAFGRLAPGWASEGRPVETEAKAEQTYAALRARAGL